ncbi:hypothetical protein ABZS66_35670 [Dactylosporangium sp. NPDC005572]|uniref:hypothetical protein n=1 Tax=Dactylosporangium sp. NPDC005572 TaxID=3156889 RepID=UPI0033A0789A
MFEPRRTTAGYTIIDGKPHTAAGRCAIALTSTPSRSCARIAAANSPTVSAGAPRDFFR